MKSFANLINTISLTLDSNILSRELASYFMRSSDPDSIWALALLSGHKPRRIVTIAKLKDWTLEFVNLPEWIFTASLQLAGDITETCSLLLPASGSTEDDLSYWMEYIFGLEGLTTYEQKEKIFQAWNKLDTGEHLLFNKLITGGFRNRIPQTILTAVIAKVTGISKYKVASQLITKWYPESITFHELFFDTQESHDFKPFPFFHHISQIYHPNDLGFPHDWFAERKWDGIRCQLVRRSDAIYLWTPKGELVTQIYPEIANSAHHIPDGTVLDGEILAFIDGVPSPKTFLGKRHNRQTISKKVMKEVPVVFCAFDLLEHEGMDMRTFSYQDRRERLESILMNHNHSNIIESELIEFEDWEGLDRIRKNSRNHYSEGIILKRKDSIYTNLDGNSWWKWENDPFYADTVLMYVERSFGFDLSVNYTFGVRSKQQLIPLVKLSEKDLELLEEEITEINRFIKEHTTERFGPVRVVQPELVFELAFKSIEVSNRRKSGILINHSRVIKWKKEYTLEQVSTLAYLTSLLA